MVCQRITAFDQAFNALVICVVAIILLCIHNIATARLRLIAWQCWIILDAGNCDVLLAESTVVTLTNKKRKMITKNESPNSFSWNARLKSFRYALDGLTAFFAAEHNAIIHLLITISVFIGAAFFDLSKGEWIAIIFASGLVWVTELFNTAIERLADLVSKDVHPGIKFIKDVSAAAVLVAAIVAFLTGAIIFLPKIFM